jgi:hypothetical protein
MKRPKAKSLIVALLLVATLAETGTSFAGIWQRHHPRRVEVNSRLRNQNRRINAGLKDHQLTRNEAHQLRSEDRSVLHQERFDAAANGSHLTRGEKRQLNQEENGISGQIHADRVEGN